MVAVTAASKGLLDRAARLQRDQRRSGGAARASDTSGQNAAG